MSVSLNGLTWSPIIEGKTALAFVTTAMSCTNCVNTVVGISNEFIIDDETKEILGGHISNIEWKFRGYDVADQCDLCGAALPKCMGDELRFTVRVAS